MHAWRAHGCQKAGLRVKLYACFSTAKLYPSRETSDGGPNRRASDAWVVGGNGEKDLRAIMGYSLRYVPTGRYRVRAGARSERAVEHKT
jgi:hypothetical protein